MGAVTTLSKKYRFSVCANRVFGKIFKLGPHDLKNTIAVVYLFRVDSAE